MAKNAFNSFSIFLVLLVAVLAGCSGTRTFHDYARAGDTVAIGAGWKHHMQRDNIQVTITDAGSPPTVTVYSPGAPAVRGSINFYPDPISSLVISDRIGQHVTPSSLQYANLINQQSTNYDRDWWETVIFVDLPDSMALGDATIDIVDLNSPASETASSVVTIVPDDTGTGAGGTANLFSAKLPPFVFNMVDSHFRSMERVEHYTVSFSGPTVPHAIQIDLLHDQDQAHGGTGGVPYVVNPTGHIKNVSWAPTGTSGTATRVIMTPAEYGEKLTMNDFKFYIAGGVKNLSLGSIEAFDINGDLITDMNTPDITQSN
jgi:hypothetical protein